MIKANEARAMVEERMEEERRKLEIVAKNWCEKLSEKILDLSRIGVTSTVETYPFKAKEEIAKILIENNYKVRKIKNQIKFEISW